MPHDARLPLALTTPLTKGPAVRLAQTKLAASRFGNFHPGEIDGVYGEQSAAATRRAKFWLGYPEDKINGSYGFELHSYLNGSSLPIANRLRRRKRLAAHADRPLRLKAFDVAKANLGQTEHPPNSNHSKFTEWYGVVGPWCAMFVTFCYVKAGSKGSFVKGSNYSYTPYMTRDARAGVHALRLLKADEVKRGDVVMFDWGGDGPSSNPYLTDHVGLFDEWIVPGRSFKTIEGNTAVGNDSNGGIVMHRPDRTMPFVEAFIRAEK